MKTRKLQKLQEPPSPPLGCEPSRGRGERHVNSKIYCKEFSPPLACEPSLAPSSASSSASSDRHMTSNSRTAAEAAAAPPPPPPALLPRLWAPAAALPQERTWASRPAASGATSYK